MRDAKRVVAALGLDGDVRQAEQGCSHHTFEVTPGWMFRFARDEAVAASLHREIAMLPVIARHVSFAVPTFEHVGTHDDLPFVGYRRIAGRELSLQALERGGHAPLGNALRELHSVSLHEAVARLGDRATCSAWGQRYRRLREEARQRVFPILAPQTADAIEQGFARFLDVDLPALSNVAVVHNDLGCAHLLIDATSGKLNGIIDFEEVSIGDPTIDFVGILITCGLDAVRRIHRAHGGLDDEHFEGRLRFYTWMGAYHEIEYQLRQGDEAAAHAATESLEQRLRAAALLPPP